MIRNLLRFLGWVGLLVGLSAGVLGVVYYLSERPGKIAIEHRVLDAVDAVPELVTWLDDRSEAGEPKVMAALQALAALGSPLAEPAESFPGDRHGRLVPVDAEESEVGAGVTTGTISCTGPNGYTFGLSALDPSQSLLALKPGTYNCAIVIDP